MGEGRYGSAPHPQSLTYVLFSADQEAGVIRYRGQVRLPAGPGSEREEWQQAESVTFSFPSSDQLRVVVSSAQGRELLSRTFDAKDYTCESGAVIIRRTRWIGNEGGLGRDSRFFDLHPLDTDLIVRARRKTLGLAALVMPVGGSESSWYRFTRLRD
jgi:hypothetical protein